MVQDRMTAVERRRGWLILGGVVVAMVVGAQFLPKGEQPTAAPDYAAHCASGFNQARKLTDVLRNADLTIGGPNILRADPPPRIQCGFRDDDTRVGVITVEILCSDPSDRRCSKVIAVVAPNGQLAYAAPTDPGAQAP